MLHLLLLTELHFVRQYYIHYYYSSFYRIPKRDSTSEIAHINQAKRVIAIGWLVTSVLAK